MTKSWRVSLAGIAFKRTIFRMTKEAAILNGRINFNELFFSLNLFDLVRQFPGENENACICVEKELSIRKSFRGNPICFCHATFYNFHPAHQMLFFSTNTPLSTPLSNKAKVNYIPKFFTFAWGKETLSRIQFFTIDFLLFFLLLQQLRVLFRKCG